jgi:hypothetical protein
MGRSDMFLKLEIIKKVLVVLVVLIFYKSGVFWFMFSSAVILGPLSVVINAWPNRKLLGYSIGMQLRDVSGMLIASLIMGSVLWFTALLCDTYLKGDLQIHLYFVFKLLLLSVLGIFVYGLMARLFRIEALDEYLNVMRRNVKK